MGATLGALLAAAGIDPTGLDLPWLAKLKAETEAMIAAGRDEPDFPKAAPAFNPPERMPPVVEDSP
jgi:hypothetical protein